jgi:four helix bundle protein
VILFYSPEKTKTMLKFKIYSFETLDVWKETRKLTLKIYQLTKKFLSEEKFGLISQMRRASISISSNISEGSSRQSLKDQARFSEISFGSLMELLNQCILCFDLNYLKEPDLIEIRINIDSIGFKLDGLRKSQVTRHTSHRRLNE